MDFYRSRGLLSRIVGGWRGGIMGAELEPRME